VLGLGYRWVLVAIRWAKWGPLPGGAACREGRIIRLSSRAKCRRQGLLTRYIAWMGRPRWRLGRGQGECEACMRCDSSANRFSAVCHTACGLVAKCRQKPSQAGSWGGGVHSQAAAWYCPYTARTRTAKQKERKIPPIVQLNFQSARRDGSGASYPLLSHARATAIGSRFESTSLVLGYGL